MNSFSMKHPARAISLSPINKFNKYETICNKSRIQKTCSFFNQRLFEPRAPIDPLVILEKSVSKNDMRKTSYNRSLSRKRTARVDCIDHAVDENMPMIINLPKLPFGKHCSYNEEGHFVKNHIIYEETQVNDIQIAEIKKVSRRLLLNKKLARKKGSPLMIMLKNDIKYKDFENETGSLHRQINKEQCENCIKQKLNYSQVKSQGSAPKSGGISENYQSWFRNASPLESRDLDLSFMLTRCPQVSLQNKYRIFKPKNNILN